MSDQVEGIKLVRLAAMQIQHLSPQVVNAARILAARSTSKVALENMDVFRDTWEKHVRLLTEAVDEITTIEDFLAVSENHILEDINLCIQSMVERNPDRKTVCVYFELKSFFICRRSRSNGWSDSRSIDTCYRCCDIGNGKIRIRRIYSWCSRKCSSSS